MSIAQPYARDSLRRFQTGLFLAVLAFNGMVLMLLALAAAGTFRNPDLPAPSPAQEAAEQIDQMRASSRPGSLMHSYADFLEQARTNANGDPNQMAAQADTWLSSLPAATVAKLVGVAALFGVLLLLALILALVGLYRLVTGPPLRRRWQRWQRGVVSPLPLWGLLVGCLILIAALFAVRGVIHAPDSIFLQLGIWEAGQACLIAGLVLVAATAGCLHPWRDFGFGRATFRSIGAGLKYYFALLPVFWLLAIVGAFLFALVDSAAGSPSALDKSPETIQKIIAPANGNWGPLALFVAAVILAPIFEELFFRGFLYGGLRRWLNAPAAMVISAAVFAGMHPMQNHLPIFFLGMFLAYTYEKTGNLGASMAVHFTHNLIVMIMMGLVFL